MSLPKQPNQVNRAPNKLSRAKERLWENLLRQQGKDELLALAQHYLAKLPNPLSKDNLLLELKKYCRNKDFISQTLSQVTKQDKLILLLIKISRKGIRPDDISALLDRELQNSKLALPLLLLSMQERMLLIKDDQYLFINPLLEDKLLPSLNLGLLFPSLKELRTSKLVKTWLEPGLFIGVLIFLLELNKIPHELTKKLEKNLEERFKPLFNGKAIKTRFFPLVKIIEEAGIIYKSDFNKKLFINWKSKTLSDFLNLNAAEQGIQLQAMFLDISVEELELFLRLIPARAALASKDLAKIYKMSIGNKGPEFEDLLRRLRVLKILLPSDFLDGENNKLIYKNDRPQLEEEAHLLRISSDMVVHLKHVSSQDELLLLSCCRLQRFDREAQYLIERELFQNCFSADKQLYNDWLSAIRNSPNIEIAQQVLTQLSVWQSDAARFLLYSGLILVVPESYDDIIRSRPELLSNIISTIRPGVYLVYENDQAWQAKLSELGISPFYSDGAKLRPRRIELGSTDLEAPDKIISRELGNPYQNINLTDGSSSLEYNLANYIEDKVATVRLHENQMQETARKARGTDYNKKRNLLSSIINNKTALAELSILDPETYEIEQLLVLPLKLDGKNSNLLLAAIRIPSEEYISLPLAKMTTVKEVFYSIILEDLHKFFS